MMLPGENEAIKRVKIDLASEIDAMGKYVEVATAIEEAVPWDSGPYPDFVNRNVASSVRSLFVTLCKKFRSVEVLCKIAQADSGEILVRSMFESVAWIYFILISELKIHVKSHGEQMPSCDQRATIYWAHCEKETLRMLKKLEKLENSPEELAKTISTIESALEDSYNKLDPIWAERMKTGSGMAGYNLFDMSLRLGLKGLYITIYPSGSTKVHVTDPIEHLSYDDEQETVSSVWVSDVAKIRSCIQGAAQCLGESIKIFAARFQIDDSTIEIAMRSHLQAFGKDIDSSIP